jgi:hypothetical protein
MTQFSKKKYLKVTDFIKRATIVFFPLSARETTAGIPNKKNANASKKEVCGAATNMVAWSPLKKKNF